MRRTRRWVIPGLALVLVLTLAAAAVASPRYLFKVATLAPEGSVWAQRFAEFVAELTRESQGEIGFKVYPGGVMGDDRAMYRKLQIGQLQGGGFTMTGIGAVVPDFRVLGVPFLFRSYAEADQVRQRLLPRFQEAFRRRNLELLAISEVGFIYTMSQQPIRNVAELKATRCWVPQDDPMSQAFLKQVGVVPIQLAIPDVLTSLQTGMVETVFNSFYGAIVLQWFTKIRYVTDIPFGYAYGALVFDRRAFRRLPGHYQELVHRAARHHFARLDQATRQSNQEARQVLADSGVTFVQAEPAALGELRRYRDQVVEQLAGKVFSRQIYQDLQAELAAVRRQAGNQGAGD